MVLKEELGSMTAQLGKIVGSEFVSDDQQVLEAYSKDESFAPPRKPRLVVKPKDASEVQAIVTWANQTGTALIPVSSGPPRFRGDTVPGVGGAVIVDLSRMKKIVRIDRRNRMALVEPGVTWSELQPELTKQGLKLPMPLLPRSNKSVIASLLEREPITIPKYQWQLFDPLRCTEVVWGNGEKFKTGEAGDYGTLEDQWKKHLAQVDGTGPGQLDYYRFLTGAQGTMGIVTWASVRCGVLPKLQKLFFVEAKKLDDLIDFTYRILRFKYADELLILNRANLAYILGEEAAKKKDELPPWVLVLCVAGYERLPQVRLDFQENDIRDIAQQYGHQLLSAVAGVRDRQVQDMINKPSSDPYWKLRYKGGSHDILFINTLNRAPELVKAVTELSEATGYPSSEIGIYLQPLMQGVACHYEFVLPFAPNNGTEVARVKKIVNEGSESLMCKGAFFSRPYGAWAEAAYQKDAQNTMVLRNVKKIFDPNNVLNPGKLCF